MSGNDPIPVPRKALSLRLYRRGTALLQPLADLVLKKRLAAGKEDKARIDERRGVAGRERPDGHLIWIHGASVGESLSILPLIDRLAHLCPDSSFLVTTGTVTSAALMAERRGDPTAAFPPVLLGDLNAVPDSDEIRALTGRAASYAERFVATDVWEQVGQGSGVTYTEANPYVNQSAWPERRLDYVMVGWPRPRPVGNPVRAALFGHEPVEGVVASDHWGVVADLAAPGDA